MKYLYKVQFCFNMRMKDEESCDETYETNSNVETKRQKKNKAPYQTRALHQCMSHCQGFVCLKTFVGATFHLIYMDFLVPKSPHFRLPGG